MKLSQLCLTFLIMAQLNGCATRVTADLNDSRTSSDQDTLIGVAYTQADSKSLPANHYVILGEKYIYVSEQLNQALQIEKHLSQPLTWLMQNDTWQLSRVIDRKNADQNPKYDAFICWAYKENQQLSTENRAKEQQILTQAGFKLPTPAEAQFLGTLTPVYTNKIPENTKSYVFCTASAREFALYKKPKDITSEKPFEQAWKVEIIDEIQNSRSKRALKAVAMPFAVATDIVTSPLQVIGGIYIIRNLHVR